MGRSEEAKVEQTREGKRNREGEKKAIRKEGNGERKR